MGRQAPAWNDQPRELVAAAAAMAGFRGGIPETAHNDRATGP
jgi:hypothetical protein